jgi:hypothetical protein
VTKAAAQQTVLEKYPTARECVMMGSRNVFIGVGLNTVLGEGTTAYLAWRNAAWKIDLNKDNE